MSLKLFILNNNLLLYSSFLQQLISGIQYNDMLRPLKLLSSELVKRKTKTGAVARHHGIYRELLFLSFAAIGRENIDQSKIGVYFHIRNDFNAYFALQLLLIVNIDWPTIGSIVK